MTSKEALEKMLGDLKNYESYFADGGYYDNEERFEIIKKDLDLFEKYRKIEKEIGVDFITLVKMLKDGVYINTGGFVDEIYRKIEKEIGVDFITLVKMLKDGVYINDGGIVGEIGHIYKEQVKSIEHWPVWGFSIGENEMKTFYAFKDRGKTWALSKEEFYENISEEVEND